MALRGINFARRNLSRAIRYSEKRRAAKNQWHVPATLVAGVVLSSCFVAAPLAHADLLRGVGKIVSGVFAVPLSTLAGTVSGPPIIGTLLGAISGTVNGVGLVVGGAFEVAASAIPIAKAAAPYVLPFLL